jgi:hypothetical protein
MWVARLLGLATPILAIGWCLSVPGLNVVIVLGVVSWAVFKYFKIRRAAYRMRQESYKRWNALTDRDYPNGGGLKIAKECIDSYRMENWKAALYTIAAGILIGLIIVVIQSGITQLSR